MKEINKITFTWYSQTASKVILVLPNSIKTYTIHNEQIILF
jgi:hypothetical protein